MNTKDSPIHSVVMLCLALTFVALCGEAARADTITYTVAVNTSSINTTSGFINMQFNPGGGDAPSATATVLGFSSMGGVLGTTMNTGNVTGMLPAAVNFTNLSAFNDLFQNSQFGTSFTFNLTLNNPGSATATSGTLYTLALFAANGVTPLLTTRMDGALLQFMLNPNGTIGAMNFGGNFVTAAQQGAPIPEPATLLLLGTGLAGIAACRMRKSAN